jgi:ketopantoate reductase
VAFLVRPGRKAQLDRDGLAIESPSAGDWRGPVRAVLAEEVRPGWDVVLLACKAYDLDAAIEAVRPAVDGRTAVLPLLNGLSHIEALEAAFGPGRVLGGLAKIQATLAPAALCATSPRSRPWSSASWTGACPSASWRCRPPSPARRSRPRRRPTSAAGCGRSSPSSAPSPRRRC